MCCSPVVQASSAHTSPRRCSGRSTRLGHRRPLHGVDRQHRPPEGPAGFYYVIDTVMNEPRAGRTGRQLRRRVPPGRGGRRAPHRRSTGAHDRDERARHRGGPQARGQEPQARGGGLHVRGLRQERGGAVPRGRGPGDRRRRKHRWAYACSKAIDEFLALAYWKAKRKLPVIVVRLFNTVGPRQTGRYGMVVPNFVRQALAGEPITVYGDGTQTRCFGYVGDVVGALTRDRYREPKAAARSSTSATRRISIRGLAERVKALTGSPSRSSRFRTTRRTKAGFEDMPRRVPDLTKLRALIGYQLACRPRRDPAARRRLPADALSLGLPCTPACPPLRRIVAETQRDAAPPAPAPRGARPGAAHARNRADRGDEYLQRDVHVLPARRHEAPPGHHGHGAVSEDRRRVRGARHRPRPHAQLWRGLRRQEAAGEIFVYAKSRGIPEVGVITNGSLLGPDVAKAVVEAGLDAINISLDAAGKEDVRVDPPGPEITTRSSPTLRASSASGANSGGNGRSSSCRSSGRIIRPRNRPLSTTVRCGGTKIHITELHNWAGTLKRRSDVNFPCYRQWLTFTVLWDGRVSLCCADLDGHVCPR